MQCSNLQASANQQPTSIFQIQLSICLFETRNERLIVCGDLKQDDPPQWEAAAGVPSA
jgi:hypothetical protein